MQREYKISLSQEHYSDVVYLSQYDTDYSLYFNVMSKYASANVDGMTCKFTGTRSDGLGFTFNSTAAGSHVSFEINTSLTAVAGTHTAEIVFYDSHGLYFGSANVQVIVEPAARPDGTIDADTERAQEIADEIQEIVDNAAAEVKGEAESWAVGERDGEPVPSTDPAYHNNAKYYAEQAAATVESISDVTDQVDENTENISSLKEDLNASIEYENLTWEHGGINLSTGELVSDGSLVRSRVIAYLDTRNIYFVSNNSEHVLWILFYEKNNDGYSYVNAINVDPHNTWDMSINHARYMRLDYRSSIEDAAGVYVVNKTAFSSIENIETMSVAAREEISKEYVTLKLSDFFRGDIGISGTEINYGNYNRRVATRRGITFHLNKGDTIYLSDYTDARFYVFYEIEGLWYSGAPGLLRECTQ